MLLNNTIYCGCPIQLTYGDRPNQGVWVLDTSVGKGNLVNVPLAGVENFPIYKTFEIRHEQELITLLESPNNFIKLKVDVNLLGLANHLMKTHGSKRWTVEPLPLCKDKTKTKGRMDGIQENETEKILDTWLDSKGLSQHMEFKDIAMKYLIAGGMKK